MRLGLFVMVCHCAANIQENGVLQDAHYDPDIFRNISQLISSKGYPVEEHQVQTKDGYILSVQRIPDGRQSNNVLSRFRQPRPVVLLHHGFLTNGIEYVINFPEQSLGFVLADAGYDVWITNARGCTYSRKHVSFSPKEAQFWDFSWDEMALIDLPATIDYILNSTGQDSMFYVGHSMGATVIFALLSDQPEYNAKIKVAAAMAPVVFLGHIKVCLPKPVEGFLSHEVRLIEHIGHGELLPQNFVELMAEEIFCKVDLNLCDKVFLPLFGVEPKHLNKTRSGVYLTAAPTGSSVRTLLHYLQLYNGTFQKYDFGTEENIRRYNQSTPPRYSIETITAPMALLWGMNDNIADPVDVLLLASKIQNLVLSYQVADPEWGHNDFGIAFDAYQFVYKEILKLFSKY